MKRHLDKDLPTVIKALEELQWKINLALAALGDLDRAKDNEPEGYEDSKIFKKTHLAMIDVGTASRNVHDLWGKTYRHTVFIYD